MVTLKTDWVDGDYVYAKTTADDDGFNGITNEINRKGVIHRKVYESAAEETTTSGSYEDTSKTFDLVAPVNSLIIGINVIAKLKNSLDAYTSVSLKISGTNLGTKYLTTDETYLTYYNPNISASSTISPFLSSSEKYLFFCYGPPYQQFSLTFNKPIKLLDGTTNFLLRQNIRNYGTGYIKDVVIEVIYVENFEEDA